MINTANPLAQQMTEKLEATKHFFKVNNIDKPTFKQLHQVGLNTRERKRYRLMMR